MNMAKKNVTAYVLSKVYGTVQIGEKVYQPATGAVFRGSGKPWLYSASRRWEEGIIAVPVSEQSMAGAREAIKKSAAKR